MKTLTTGIHGEYIDKTKLSAYEQEEFEYDILTQLIKDNSDIPQLFPTYEWWWVIDYSMDSERWNQEMGALHRLFEFEMEQARLNESGDSLELALETLILIGIIEDFKSCEWVAE